MNHFESGFNNPRGMNIYNNLIYIAKYNSTSKNAITVCSINRVKGTLSNCKNTGPLGVNPLGIAIDNNGYASFKAYVTTSSAVLVCNYASDPAIDKNTCVNSGAARWTL